MPSHRMTIERDKIRHRRPDDMREIPDDEPYPYLSDGSEPVQYGAEDYEDASESWSDEEDAWSEEAPPSSDDDQGWDDEPDEEWGFEEADDQDPEDESGIIWGDDDDAEADVVDDDQGYDGDEQFAPEPVHAGRRNHRPQAPRSFTPDPHLNDHQSYDNVERYQPDVAPNNRQHGRPQPSRPLPPEPRLAPARSTRPNNGRRAPNPSRHRVAQEPAGVVSQFPPSPPTRQPPPPGPNGRFARPEALVEAPQERPLPQSDQFRGPPQQNRRTTSRRNQPSLAPVMLPVRKRRFGGVLVKVLVLGCLVIGGWSAFQEPGKSSFSDLLTKITELVGLSSERTAADTSFGAPATTPATPTTTTTTTTTPEKALAGLTSGANGSETHLPKFKPRDEGQPLDDGTPLPPTATPPEDGEAPTIFDRIWSYFQSR